MKITLQLLVASNFAIDRENVRRELCVKVIIPFYIIGYGEVMSVNLVIIKKNKLNSLAL